MRQRLLSALAFFALVPGLLAAQDDVISVGDPYGDDRFESDVDARTGYKTTSVIAAPIHDHGKHVIGVLQVLNKD